MSNKHYSINLTFLSGEIAPEGPGWYIIGYADVLNTGRIKVTSSQAKEIARAVEVPLTGKDLAIHPFEIVTQGTAILRETAAQELAEAERAAARIATLRRTLQETE